MEKDSPLALDNALVWNSGSGYFIDGYKEILVIKEINQKTLEEIKNIEKRRKS